MSNKVLYIETCMGFGGSAISLYELVSNLKESEVSIVFFAAKEKQFTNIFKEFDTYFLDAKYTYIQKESLNKKVSKISKYLPPASIMNKLFIFFSAIEDYILYRKIGKSVKEKNISIIHTNNCVDPVSLKVARKLNVPVIVHLRGHVDCAGMKGRKYNKIFHTLIAPTYKICDYAITELFVDKAKVKVIYDSVDPDLYDRAEQGASIRKFYKIPNKTVVLGMFARIIPMKGQIELAKAVRKLLLDNHDILVMIVGDASDGDIEYYTALKKFIKDSGISKKFIFTGYRENVPDYYNVVDIVIHGSIANEAFGRVIIEGWAAHKPVIATRIAASEELINNEEDGILVDVKDIDELSVAIKRLVLNQEERKFLANKGYQRITETFSSCIVANTIENLYKEVTCQGN